MNDAAGWSVACGVGIQPSYDVPNDHSVENWEVQWITSGERGSPLISGWKLIPGQRNNQLKL